MSPRRGRYHRTSADHQAVAAQAKQSPGRWVRAGAYGSGYSAESAATQVRHGVRMRAYAPPGAFEARGELTDMGADLYVRYVGPDPAFSQSLAQGLTEDLAAFSTRLAEAAGLTQPTTGRRP